MQDKIIKVGIIGCGGIANKKHMPALKKVADCEMVAFCDIVPEKAEKAEKPAVEKKETAPKAAPADPNAVRELFVDDASL